MLYSITPKLGKLRIIFRNSKSASINYATLSIILIGIMIKAKTIAQFRVPYVELF